MKLFMKQLTLSLAMGAMIPALIISVISDQIVTAPSALVAAQEVDWGGAKISVIDSDGKSHIMALEEYITGVVLGEVSADFHEEALKAQAVAARTYTMYCINVLKKHSGGAVCMDYRCCQAYRDPEDYVSNGGAKQGLQKIQSAVLNTAGEVLEYDSELICATYFASSGGQTEDAFEVWGKNYPYLKSVESPGEENCGYFSEEITISSEEFQGTLGVSLTGSPYSWFGFATDTVGGGVDLMRIGGKLYTGVELRKLLNLRSTVAAITPTEDEIMIATKGYGHRVGMSQHGANAMANNNCSYEEILSHYYTGVTLQRMKTEVDSTERSDND